MYNIHMYINIIASLFAFAGFYIIFTNKIRLNKNHFTTLHGKIGIAILICMTLQAVLSYFKLHPTQSVIDRRPYRNYHIWFGKSLIIASFIECLYGIYVIGNQNVLIIASSLTFLYLLVLIINIKKINKFVGIVLYESQ